MRWLLSTVLLLLWLPACRNREAYDTTITQKLARGDFRLPSAYGPLYLYVAVKGGLTGITHIGQLHSLYKRYYSDRYPSFEEFLPDALNQRLMFLPKHLEKTNGSLMTISPRLQAEYNQGGLAHLLKQHFTLGTNRRYRLHTKRLKEEEVQEVLYFCFINRYKVTLDCYIGSYYVEPW